MRENSLLDSLRRCVKEKNHRRKEILFKLICLELKSLTLREVMRLKCGRFGIEPDDVFQELFSRLLGDIDVTSGPIWEMILREETSEKSCRNYLRQTVTSIIVQIANRNWGSDFKDLTDSVRYRLGKMHELGKTTISRGVRRVSFFHKNGAILKNLTVDPELHRLEKCLLRKLKVTYSISSVSETEGVSQSRRIYSGLDESLAELMSYSIEKELAWSPSGIANLLIKLNDLSSQVVPLEYPSDDGTVTLLNAVAVVFDPVSDMVVQQWVDDTITAFQRRKSWVEESRIALLYYITKNPDILELTDNSGNWKPLANCGGKVTKHLGSILNLANGTVFNRRRDFKEFLNRQLRNLDQNIEGKAFVGFLNRLISLTPVPEQAKEFLS